jgi:hypothetical protein
MLTRRLRVSVSVSLCFCVMCDVFVFVFPARWSFERSEQAIDLVGRVVEMR